MGNEPSPREDPRFLEMKKTMYHDALGMGAALAGFLASGAFLSVMYYPHFWILSTMVACLGNLMEELRKKEMGGLKRVAYGWPR